MKNGFSLVELSIVLVILGLLVGGILAGQSLIRAAELRAVSTEYQRYVTAVHSFRDKYFQLPGDMNNATRVWGDDNTNCPDAAITNGSPGTCNGDGNGTFWYGSAGGTSELFQFWKQLALAGLIEGTYSGLAASGGIIDMVPGTNIPRSRLNNGSWGVREYWGNFAGAANDVFAGQYGNLLQFGGSLTPNDNAAVVLKPEEAWNIDSKIDDGMPGKGKVIARGINNCTNATSELDTGTTYKLSSTSLACVLLFSRAF